MNHPNLATYKQCTGCGACVDTCHKLALSISIADDGHMYVLCDDDKCVLCHQCENVCPVVNKLEYASNTKKESVPYSVYCTDNEIYKKSTSGGAFAAMAFQFINEGGYVCGAVFDGNHVKHIVSNQKKDIMRMQGSKYMQSSLLGIYQMIADLLKQGNKVLFCGMGCQSAAIYSYFKKNKNRDLLYIIDMICGGVPSSLLAKNFLENESNFKRIVGYREKGKYILSCLNQNNEIEYLYYRNLPIVGFGSGLTNRYSCVNCHFCGIERLSDITIGDHWIPQKRNNIHKSIAIVHTSKGYDLLQKTATLSKRITDWSFIKYNYRCVIGKTINRYSLRRKLLAWNFKHLSYKTLCGLYGCNLKNPIWLFLKIYSVIIKTLDRLVIKIQLNFILKKISHS